MTRQTELGQPTVKLIRKRARPPEVAPPPPDDRIGDSQTHAARHGYRYQVLTPLSPRRAGGDVAAEAALDTSRTTNACQCGKGDYFSNDNKGARACRRPHRPPGVKGGAPTISLQSGPFERSGNRYGQCGPVGSAQDAAARVEAAPLSRKGEISKIHRTRPGNAHGAGRVAGPAAPCRHRQHGSINEASTQLGDAGLPRPIARLLRRSQRCPIVARRCHGKITCRWPVGCGGEHVAKVRGRTDLSAPSRHKIVE
jgi:hypothetical protein